MDFSEAGVVAILATISTVAGIVGAVIGQIVAALKVRGQIRVKSEADLRSQMIERLERQDARIDTQVSNMTILQGKLVDAQVALGILSGEKALLAERVTNLETVNATLTARVADSEKERVALLNRIDALEKERSTLLARIDALEAERIKLLDRIALLEQELVEMKTGKGKAA